ncbi:glycoside hydrolase family 16 protein [Phanerochaete carnosa HHB-10118-sp]|uniref:Glycoside hydrolase family 16 protein n=1 Tax=Phanerochaete carnosa (strain HHB-10118-sp) TaxID=650164 RepID=K5WPG7_PHACS|nr:glycoside hydrolase family 16 protein [Phanerochaete carnosa HHB-10118-sp]EKM61134.1 glycoside hydrolase family 16 protein [Phanerochaete carnosa HHB-10118-sp]
MASLKPKPYARSTASSTTSLLIPQSRSPAPQATFAQSPRSATVSEASFDDTRYTGRSAPIPQSISDKFSLSPNPNEWGANLSIEHPEPDDFIHNPDPRRDRKSDRGGDFFTYRALANLGCLVVLLVGLLALFAGYPIISHFTKQTQSTLGGFNLGGINASGQIASMPGNWGLVDLETPSDAYTKQDYKSGKSWQLIFSDEFNTDGRTFYPGDDPYWEAVDLHYWETNNLEWYDPAAITTANGSLQITLSQKQTHGLNYQGGMMSSWNKFCFTGGLIEVSAVLPGINNIVGLWPAVWTMGNLGRAGYGASLEGMWPYTYDSCDIGTVANQTMNGLPVAATTGGDPSEDGVLSFLPGQRLSRCTCTGESHPGPVHSDGTYVGRSAPEIDIFEAQITDGSGQVSQSAQWGPFNAGYEWFNTSSNLIIPEPNITQLNTYIGGAYQQATSGVTESNQEAYELTGNQFAVYGFQYQPGFDGGYISWIANDQVAWTLEQAGMAADTRVEIGSRPVPQEPMYIIANLGMSTNFGPVDLEHLTFPTTMKIDYIRVYQDPDNINYGCDPKGFPTEAYINTYIEAYTNPNLTTWRNDYGQPFPKNSFLGQC